MKPYADTKHSELRGISSCRKSKDTTHRRRCLRVDKKRARKEAQLQIKNG